MKPQPFSIYCEKFALGIGLGHKNLSGARFSPSVEARGSSAYFCRAVSCKLLKLSAAAIAVYSQINGVCVWKLSSGELMRGFVKLALRHSHAAGAFAVCGSHDSLSGFAEPSDDGYGTIFPCNIPLWVKYLNLSVRGRFNSTRLSRRHVRRLVVSF